MDCGVTSSLLFEKNMFESDLARFQKLLLRVCTQSSRRPAAKLVLKSLKLANQRSCSRVEGVYPGSAQHPDAEVGLRCFLYAKEELPASDLER